MDEANRMQAAGIDVLKLNIGNPAPFGFHAPDEVIKDMSYNLRDTEGYSDSKGLFSARKAIMQYCQLKHIPNVGIDDIYTGNGVSELITMSMQGLLNNGDEILVPSPDYPLWTASVTLAGGTAVHYICDEQSDWYPDIDDMRSKITPNTKGIVVINPNNPTGALYPKEILEQIVDLAREFDLILFADEIYDRLVMDGRKHVALASLAPDVFTISFNGLSKSHRVAGYRIGWMCLCGRKDHVKGYIEGLNLLSSMRLCSNVPAQSIVQTSLGGYQSADELLLPGGRIYEQREYIYNALCDIPGVSVVKPKAAFYIFPKLDQEKFHIKDDEKFALDLLRVVDEGIFKQAAIWGTVYQVQNSGGSLDQYERDPDTGSALIPALEIDTYISNLLGPDYQVTEGTFSTAEFVYQYDEEKQAYLVPVTSSVALYTPTVEKITKKDGQRIVTVGYVPTSSNNATGELSLTAPTEPTKYMDYVFTRGENRQWYLTALRDSEMQVEVTPIPAPTDAVVDNMQNEEMGTSDAASTEPAPVPEEGAEAAPDAENLDDTGDTPAEG